LLYSSQILAGNQSDTNDWLLQIQTAVEAADGRISYSDILDFIFKKQPPVDNVAPLNLSNASQTPVDPEESDTDDEAVVDYGPGKVKATEKMWKFLNQMRAAPLTVLDEILNSGLYDFTFQTDVIKITLLINYYSFNLMIKIIC